MYIVLKSILDKNHPYYLRLNRKASGLELYEEADSTLLWEKYPVRKDFDASDYVVYKLIRTMPCIYGGEGKKQTPSGIFKIQEISRKEYISSYYARYDQVKFFGYLVVFEDYFIHSDLYSMDADIDNFREKESVSLQDKHTAGCIRVSQEDLEWLIRHVPVGSVVEM